MSMSNKIRYKMAIIPAIIFWIVSMVFFVLGLSFGTIDQFTFRSFMTWISIGLAISNTIIQIIGNDADPDDLGWVLMAGWICSYVLGISSNVNSLLQILSIRNMYIEWAAAISLGAMIEFMPERLFVLFWRSTFPHGIIKWGSLQFGGGSQSTYRPQVRSTTQQTRGQSKRPRGMPRAEWQQRLVDDAKRDAKVKAETFSYENGEEDFSFEDTIRGYQK